MPTNAFDSDAYAEINVRYNGGSKAIIRIPWFGYNPNSATQQNNYSIVSPRTANSGIGPSGGWSIQWNPEYQQVWMGSNSNTTTTLNAYNNTTPVSVTNGNYGASNLFQYYDGLFKYNKKNKSFGGQQYNYSTQNTLPSAQQIFTAKAIQSKLISFSKPQTKE